ncbi:MAG: roadblock/LC7 domain-containing protein [Nocardioides sp.]
MAVDGPSSEEDAARVNSLLQEFYDAQEHVEYLILVAPDGLLTAAISPTDRGLADRLAAVVSGLISVAKGGVHVLGGGGVCHLLVEMFAGHLFVSTLSDGSAVGIRTTSDADLGAFGFEHAVLVDRLDELIGPDVLVDLKSALVD